MRLAIISDTHFGDTSCGLVEPNGRGWRLHSGRFDRLKEIIRPGGGAPADFLVLAGDGFDFSVASYQEAYSAGREFFLRAGELARDIIFLPGNHDYGMWQLADNEINVIKPIVSGEPPKALMRSVPGVLDDRSPASGPYSARLWWPTTGVEYREERARGQERKGIFLDWLCQPVPKIKDPAQPCFWLAYPNLYLLTPGGKTMLITHGHYFSHYWALGAELAMGLAGDKLKSDGHSAVRRDPAFGDYMGLADTVGANSPLSDFACTGIGQAEPLTPVAREIQHAMKARDWNAIEPYVDRVPAALAETFAMGSLTSGTIKVALRVLKDRVRQAVETYEDARGNQDFLRTPEAAGAVGRFLLATFREIGALNEDASLGITTPDRMIYGHTHERTPWNRGFGDLVSGRVEGIQLNAFNCGGWLKPEGVRPIKAEVFIYDSNQPPEVWQSESIN
jgi:hypothetical protein